MFADLVGFTSRAERMDPEDVAALLVPYHARLRSELERHGGTVEKFIGDAVMAVFGAPVSHEDDPERAVRAALAIRNWVVEEGSLEVRIGVNTGEALVAVGARPAAGEGMATGDVINTAARLQAAAPVNGVLVGEQTFRATERAIVYRQFPAVEAKGKAAPVLVWEAVEARSRFGEDVPERPRAVLVGRRAEVDFLADALTRVQRERSPQLVTLVGVPGIGKSRLVFELFAVVEAVPELIAWRQGRSLPYGDGVSYWALGEMVKAECGILDSDDAELAEAKLRQSLEGLDVEAREAQWVEGHLRPLIGLGASTAEADGRAESFSAWRRFFEALAERRPLVLVFEDLHWADDGLLDFVDYLVDWVSGVPLLVVASTRPELLERRPGWGGGKRNAATVSLAPLTSEETARLLSALLDRSVLPAEKQAMLLERAEGNPLYTEEYARLFLQRSGAADLPLPETVQGIVAARLDALSLEEKELIQDAAVLGKVFWSGALAETRGVERWQVEERLHGLERKEFVRRERRTSVAAETQYAFLHVLVRDVAYAQIPRAARAEKHRAAARWIDSLASDRAEDRAEMLAHHYLQTLELAKAAGLDKDDLVEPAGRAFREAGDRAFALNSHAPALRFYEKALELAEPADTARPRLLLRCGVIKWWIGEQDSASTLEQARDAALGQGQLEVAVAAMTELSVIHWARGERDDATEAIEAAFVLADPLPASPEKAQVLNRRARYDLFLGKRDAVELAHTALAIADALGLDEAAAHSLNTIGMARLWAGDRGGMGEIERSLEIGQSINSPMVVHYALNNLANFHWLLGELDEARDRLVRARENIERFGLWSHLRWLDGEDVLERTFRGDWTEALQLADAFIAGCAVSPHYHEFGMRCCRARIRFARAEIKGATDDAERGLELARAAGDLQVLPPALGSAAFMRLACGDKDGAAQLLTEVLELPGASARLGSEWLTDLPWVALALGRSAEFIAAAEQSPPYPWCEAILAIASSDFQRAASIYERIGARADEAIARLRAADALAATGRRAEADAQLKPAVLYFREIGATHYLKEAESLQAQTA